MSERLKKLYKLYRFYLFPAIVGVISIGLILLVIIPQTGEVLSNQKIESDSLKKSQFLDAKVKALEGFDEADLSQKVGLSLSSYPTDRDAVNALGLLQNLSSQSGFSVISIALAGSISADTQQAQSYLIKLEAQGPTALLTGFLANIENSSRLMKIETLETNATKDSSEITASLLVKVLYSSAPKEFGTIDSPLPKFTEKDEEALNKLAKSGTQINPIQEPAKLGPRGKTNPFE